MIFKGSGVFRLGDGAQAVAVMLSYEAERLTVVSWLSHPTRAKNRVIS